MGSLEMSILDEEAPNYTLTPAQRKAKVARDARIRAARKIRAGWTPAQFAAEAERLEREKAEFLAKLVQRA